MSQTNKNNISKKDAIEALWRKGVLSWKLDNVQKELYELYHNQENRTNVWLLSRRSGKSYCLTVLALEQCIKKKNSIVKYLAQTKLQVKSVVEPLIRIICEDCPVDLKPQFNSKEYSYDFPNGSKIQLAGGDSGHAEKLRGGDGHLVLVDEAGSITGLNYIVNSILRPTTLTTKGKIILASTPPSDADHDFLGFIETAQGEGTLVKKTVYDNPRISKKDIEDAIKESGGINTDHFRREYLCIVIKNASTCVFPEFTEELEKEIIKEWKRPNFFDAYVSMDIGFKDLTGILFAYYDFLNAVLVIEDEIVFDFQKSDMTIKKLTEEILNKEALLWSNPYTNEVKKPNSRISDIDYIVMQEIMKHSGGKLYFRAAKKDNKEAAINNARFVLSNKKVIINPNCKNLIHHLRAAKWHDGAKSILARSKEGHHYDLADCFTYLIREVNFTKNPYPSTYNYDPKDLYIHRPDKFQNNSQTIEVFKKIFSKNEIKGK